MDGAPPISYVLPLRSDDARAVASLAPYLRWLGSEVDELIVVDGSAEPVFDANSAALPDRCRHLPPDPALGFSMGKVDGVTTGVLAARNEAVIVADDDVRYDAGSLRRVVALLGRAELVRPQNYFDPLPWHARLDTARSLLNRVHSGDIEFGSGDFPGTFALRRSAFAATGGYDGDVMFENLELMRTVSAAGGRVLTALDLYVRRAPPSTRHFVSQRVRQAYDDFAVPVRMTAFLSIAPALAWASARRRFEPVAVGAAAICLMAELGRRRAGGATYFPPSSALLAPIWVVERAFSAWLAVYSRLRRGGIRYRGAVIARSATSVRELRRRHGGLASPWGTESDQLVGPVAEGPGARAPAAAERDGPPS